jgi:hypothetical protein
VRWASKGECLDLASVEGAASLTHLLVFAMSRSAVRKNTTWSRTDREFQVSLRHWQYSFSMVKPAIIPQCCAVPYKLLQACDSFAVRGASAARRLREATEPADPVGEGHSVRQWPSGI